MELIYILTYDCNFRCKYCDINKKNNSITNEIIDKSFDLLEKNDILIDKVKFFWWEPLIRKDYIKYIVNNFPKKYSPKYYVTTNSTLVDQEFMKFVLDNWINITFSIDWDKNTTWTNRVLINGENLSENIIENVKKYAKFIRVNQVITSKNSSEFFKNFKFIYDLWVRKFNFLPEYYSLWSKKWLINLQKWFQEIKIFLDNWNFFELINLDNFSQTSFYNLWIVIDTDWSIYPTNLILSWKFEKYKDILKIWDVNIKNKIKENSIKKIYNEINKIIDKEYSIEILKSVKYTDLILNNFCNEFTMKK